MGRYEVTNRQYIQCVRADICIEPDNNIYHAPDYAQHPVTGVSWYDAQIFCDWVGGRLPTEAEWEYAARGGLDGEPYPWGDDAPVCETGAKNGSNYRGEGCPGSTLPVGSFAPNGYGVYDMAGNVWEWTADWLSEYYAIVEESDFNPLGPAEGQFRVVRGSSSSDDPYDLRMFNRDWDSP